MLEETMGVLLSIRPLNLHMIECLSQALSSLLILYLEKRIINGL